MWYNNELVMRFLLTSLLTMIAALIALLVDRTFGLIMIGFALGANSVSLVSIYHILFGRIND